MPEKENTEYYPEKKKLIMSEYTVNDFKNMFFCAEYFKLKRLACSRSSFFGKEKAVKNHTLRCNILYC